MPISVQQVQKMLGATGILGGIAALLDVILRNPDAETQLPTALLGLALGAMVVFDSSDDHDYKMAQPIDNDDAPEAHRGLHMPAEVV